MSEWSQISGVVVLDPSRKISVEKWLRQAVDRHNFVQCCTRVEQLGSYRVQFTLLVDEIGIEAGPKLSLIAQELLEVAHSGHYKMEVMFRKGDRHPAFLGLREEFVPNITLLI